MPLAAWTHDLDPVIFQFTDTLAIRWYGLAYVLGFLSGMWLLHIYYKKGKSPFNQEQQSSLFFAIMAGVVVGGRLGYFIFYAPYSLAADPLILLRIYEGGMASHGGFIGVACAAWIMARRFQSSFFRVSDLLCTLAPPGLLFGRIANFINGELWGKVTGSNWGVIFPEAGDPFPRHPSQLYQAGLEGLLLLIYTQIRVWKSNTLAERPGQLSGEFLVAYGIARIIGEQFREPDAGLHLGGLLSRGSFLSLFLIAAGAAIIAWARKRASMHER